MSLFAALIAIIGIIAILSDAFETILLPRRIAGRFRLSRLVLATLWAVWSWAARRIEARNARENVLALYALQSLLALFMVWAAGLIGCFGLLQWAAGSQLASSSGPVTIFTDLYMSGTNFFTLGLGDVYPLSRLARALTIVEAGTGFGFLALGLAYVPVLYQSFSRREARTTMLDEWAGSPPSAAVVLRRCFEARDPAVLNSLLRSWELASAELLESHLSYPILAFFRSQHDNQSWLASLASILDTCALVIAGVEGIDPFQARLTFAIGRHALVDLSQTLNVRPRPGAADRLTPETLARLREWLKAAGVQLDAGSEFDRRLAELRELYEPYLDGLSRRLLMPLPSWLPPERARYNWETTAWGRTGRRDAH